MKRYCRKRRGRSVARRKWQGWEKTNLVEWEGGIAGESKIEVEGEVHDVFLGVAGAGSGLDFLQAVAEEPNAVEKQTVGRALNLKISEEGVGAEEGEHLVQDVVALAVGVGRLAGGERGRGEGEAVGWAAGFGAEGEEREVADEARRVGVLVED